MVYLGGRFSHALTKRAVLAPDEVAPLADAWGEHAPAAVMLDPDLVVAGTASDAQRELADAVVARPHRALRRRRRSTCASTRSPATTRRAGRHGDRGDRAGPLPRHRPTARPSASPRRSSPADAASKHRQLIGALAPIAARNDEGATP